MTALVMVAPIRHSAMRLSSRKISALISSGDLPKIWGKRLLVVATATGKCSSVSSARRPIRRLMLVMTRSGSIVRRRRAAAPTSISPLRPIQTALGMMRFPSSLASRMGNPESTVPTAELVVPRSIPRMMSRMAGSLAGRRFAVNAGSRQSNNSQASVISPWKKKWNRSEADPENRARS